MSEVRRLHKCHDGVWRHADQAIRVTSIRVIKLDEEGAPAGDPVEISANGCAHFSFEE